MYSPDSLIIEIVTLLEERGIDLDTYTLYDYIDADALEKLITSSDASLEIRLTIEGVQLEITRDGVRVLD